MDVGTVVDAWVNDGGGGGGGSGNNADSHLPRTPSDRSVAPLFRFFFFFFFQADSPIFDKIKRSATQAIFGQFETFKDTEVRST